MLVVFDLVTLDFRSSFFLKDFDTLKIHTGKVSKKISIKYVLNMDTKLVKQISVSMFHSYHSKSPISKIVWDFCFIRHLMLEARLITYERYKHQSNI